MRTIGAMQETAFRARGLANATGDVDAYSKALNRIRWERVSAGGRILQHTARVAEYAGLVLGGSLAVMANNAAKFDTSVTLAATQTRKIGHSFTETSKNSKILQADIRQLMTEFPASAEDFSKAAYDIYSSTDVNFGKGRKALKLFAQAAVAGQTDVQTATDAGIVVLNNFGNDVSKLPKRLDQMFAAVRYGRMTFKDFATSMSTIGPAARASNQSFLEMAGTFAFLTRHLDVAKSRVGFARVLEALATPKMLAGLKDAGVTIQDVNHHLLPLHEILGRIIQRFPQLKRGGTDAMNFFKNISGNQGTMQARRAFTFLVQFFDKAGKDGASYLEMLKKVREDHGEFQNSLKAMEATTGVKWGVFVNQLKALALEVGADLVPALLKLSGPIQNVIHWWTSLDKSTRATISRFAAYSAAFLLVGGAVTFLAGTFMRLFATIGRLAGFSGAMTASFVAIGAAVLLLTGHLGSLSEVLDTITNFAFGSWQGFAITLGVAAVAAVKLTSAMRGLAAAEVTVGKGGLLSGLLGIGGNVAAGARTGLAAGGLRGMLAGASAGAAGLGAALAPVAGVVAAIGGGLLLWKLHMMEAASEAKKLKEAFDIGAAPRKFGDVFQHLTGSTEDVERARLNIRGINREISSLTKQLSTAKGAQRLDIIDQLKTLTMDRADAMNALATAVGKNNIQFNAFSKQLGSFVAIRDKAKALSGEIARLQDQLQRPGGARFSGVINSQIASLMRQFRALESQATASSVGVQKTFTQIIQGWAKIGEFKMPTDKIMGDLFNVARRMGRMITIPEVRALIKAEVDPASARALPGKIGAIFRNVKAQRIKVEADDSATKKLQAAQKLIPKGLRFPAFTFPSPEPQIKKAHAAAQNAMKPINAHIKVHPPGSGELAIIGGNITAGIQAGMTPVHQSVVKDVTVNQFKNVLGIHSPSTLMAKEVGIPLVEGIVKGILESQGTIEKAATASITFFESAAIQKAQEAKKRITNALLIGDVAMQAKTLTQFNNAIAKLGRRRVPKDLVDQLAALGPDSAKFISQIANMSEKELRRYVAAWRRANAQVKRSMRETQEDIRNASKQMHDDMMSNITSTFNSIQDKNIGQFGTIFQGPTNLAGMTGDAFKQAMEDYNNQANDFRNQIKDLNQQIVDAQNEASQRLADAIKSRADELQQAMGQLFSGDWITGTQVQTKLDWGKKLGFDDLQKDLQMQVDKFARWRSDLTAIAAKVPPELAAQLEALGPEAVDKLEVLNSGSKEQIAAYVALWQQGQNQIAAVAAKTTVDTSDITAKINDILSQIDDVTQKLSALQMPHQLTAEDIINDLKAQQNQWVEYGDILQSLADRGLPAELLQQLEQLGPDALPYLRVLNTMTDTQLGELANTFKTNQELITQQSIKELNTQLDIWFAYGKKIGLELVAGIASVAPRLNVYFKDLISQLITQGGFARPGPLPNIDEGTPNPVPPLGGASSSGAGSDGGLGRFEGGTTYNYNLTVNQAQDASLASTLETATFRLANRNVE